MDVLVWLIAIAVVIVASMVTFLAVRRRRRSGGVLVTPVRDGRQSRGPA
jgi:hypothetical protein